MRARHRSEEIPQLPTRTPAERLDEAVETVLSGRHPAIGPELAPLVDVASAVHSALGPIPAGSGFEKRVAARLAGRGPVRQVVAAIGDATRRELRHPGRILLTGAVSSAVGVGVTLLAMRRAGRRQAAPSQQPAHR